MLALASLAAGEMASRRFSELSIILDIVVSGRIILRTRGGESMRDISKVFIN
jgi:hypothetical protein